MGKTRMDTDGFNELLWSFAGHRVLTVAVRAGILRRLDRGPATADEAARELGLDPIASGKIVRALAALGVVEAKGGGRYAVVAQLAGRFTPGETDATPFVEHAHAMYERWGENLEAWLRGGDWQMRRRNPDEVRRFSEAMRAMASSVAPAAIASLDLTDVRRVLDVGGGVGAYAAAYCRARPDLAAVVLDTPEVALLGRELWAGTGLEGRIAFIEGDYLETPYGSGYDLVQIANVLHQEPRDRAARLVRQAADALAPGGRLVVVDFSIDDAKDESLMGALFAINMRSRGDTWSEPEIRAWMEAAGLRYERRVDFSKSRWSLTARKPGA
ncbi:MAG: ArsR family transcriptional regulator [Deltaproteobacteria bacterium]|nr:ArsR family transcriptional regulator [Deltaproteobacteria bacterium]